MLKLLALLVQTWCAGTCFTAAGWSVGEALNRCSIYLLYWYKSTDTGTQKRRCAGLAWCCQSEEKKLREAFYLLYSYKSINTDVKRRCAAARLACGAQFTCFTGTKVQILT